MSGPLLVIAAGGTGGHMFPAQALAEEMLGRGWRVRLSTDARGAAHAGGFPEAVRREVLASGSFAQGGALARLTVPFRLAAGTVAAMRRFRADRPACVAGFGGYPAIPALTAAWALGLPRLIHEQNAIPGQVNRRFATRVDAVACGVWPARLPAGARAVHVGNPVRRTVLEAAAIPYDPPGSGSVNLLVFGGSQGARVFAKLVPEALALLPEAMRARLCLTQQVRSEDMEGLDWDSEDLGMPPPEMAAFFRDLPARIAASHLVIARAGASSLAELAAIGRPAILIPYPHAANDHQTANAAAFGEAGAAVLAPQAALTAEALAAHIAGILGDPARAAAMAAAARGLGRPEAARDLADLVQRVSEGDGP